jgi:hypothetical protein
MKKGPTIKNLKESCDEIYYAFESPCGGGEVPYMSVSEFIDQIAPWEKITEKEFDDHFCDIYGATRAAFAIGYAFGQLLDAFEGNAELIQKAIQQKEVGLFFPHRKKAGILPLK